MAEKKASIEVRPGDVGIEAITGYWLADCRQLAKQAKKDNHSVMIEGDLEVSSEPVQLLFITTTDTVVDNSGMTRQLNPETRVVPVLKVSCSWPLEGPTQEIGKRMVYTTAVPIPVKLPSGTVGTVLYALKLPRGEQPKLASLSLAPEYRPSPLSCLTVDDWKEQLLGRGRKAFRDQDQEYYPLLAQPVAESVTSLSGQKRVVSLQVAGWGSRELAVLARKQPYPQILSPMILIGAEARSQDPYYTVPRPEDVTLRGTLNRITATVKQHLFGRGGGN